MRVHVAPRLVGRRDTISVLEVEFTTKARRVEVRGSDRLQPLDLDGERAGGRYEVSDALPRVNIPLRVLRDGPGRSRIVVVVEDATGAVPPESWEGDVVFDAPAATVERSRTTVLLGLFTAVVGAIVWFVGIPLLRARNPRVPELAGLARADAERRLKDLGIAPVVQFVDALSPDEVGRVLAQAPRRDTTVDRSSTVTISVGRGTPEMGVSVPSLVGRTETEVGDALVGTRLRVATTDESIVDATYDGRVVRQSPEAGAFAAAGSSIEVTIGRLTRTTPGEPVLPTPPAILEPAPLAGTSPTPPVVPSVPSEPGVQPDPTASVPSVLGKSRADAEANLLAAGLVPVVEVVESTLGVAGTVVSQDPPASVSRPVGSTVSVRVARAPAIAIAPPPVAPPRPPVDPVPSVPPALPVAPMPTVPPSPTVAPPPMNPTDPADPAPPPALPSTSPSLPAVPGPVPVPVLPPTVPVSPRPVPVEPPVASKAAPDVLGLSETVAASAIRDAGLGVRMQSEEVEEGDPEGLVLRQAPSAGESSPTGIVEIFVGRRTIAVTPPPVAPPSVPTPSAPVEPTTSSTPSIPVEPTIPAVPPSPPVVDARVRVPDVVGRELADAERALREAGVVVSATDWDVVAETQQDRRVLDQSPLANALVERGATVVLHVGMYVAAPAPEPSPSTVQPAGPPSGATPPTLVPPVVTAPIASRPPPPTVARPPGASLPPPAVSTRVGGAPWTSAPVTPPLGAPAMPAPTYGPPRYPTPSPTGPDVVVRPMPPIVSRPSTPVVLGTEVRVVPDFAGRDAGDAIAAAIAAGFSPVVSADRDARAAVGRVRTQSPAPGTSARTGTSIQLSVGGGYAPSMIDVPSVVGLSVADATARLAALGIQAQVVRVPARPGTLSGGGVVVVAQTPAGRVTPALAASVRLYVVAP